MFTSKSRGLRFEGDAGGRAASVELGVGVGQPAHWKVLSKTHVEVKYEVSLDT